MFSELETAEFLSKTDATKREEGREILMFLHLVPSFNAASLPALRAIENSVEKPWEDSPASWAP